MNLDFAKICDLFSVSFKIIFIYKYLVCVLSVHMHTCCGVRVEGRGLFGETAGFSPSSMCVLRATLFYQAWQQASLPAEPSCYLPNVPFKVIS